MSDIICWHVGPDYCDEVLRGIPCLAKPKRERGDEFERYKRLDDAGAFDHGDCDDVDW